MVTKMNKLKVISIIMFIVILFSLNSTVLAANFGLDVNFNGEKIEMTSETPDMTWYIKNLLPGETSETILNINNIGKKSVKVEFIASVEEGKELSDILEIKIINLSNNEEVFSGNYKEMEKLNIQLDSKKSQSYKLITYLPVEAGNEYQNKECKIKLSFVAIGQKDDVEPPKDIITDEVKPPQTGEGYTIFVVSAVAVVFIIGLIFSFYKKKRK